MPLTRLAIATLLCALATLAPGRAALAVCTSRSTCSAASILADPGCCVGNTCTIDQTITLNGAVCNLDFGAHNLVITGSLVVGPNTLSLEAASLRILGTSGQINGRMPLAGAGGNVTITTTGGSGLFAVRLDGGASSGIDVSGFDGAGTLTINGDGAVDILSGKVEATGIDSFASGGAISVDTTAGAITINAPVLASAGTGGAGGTVNFDTPGNFAVNSSGRISVIGGEGFGGEIDIDAGGTLSMASTAVLQANALNGGAGDGGEINLTAGSLNLQGMIEAKGGTDPLNEGIGGSGGSVNIEATKGSLVLLRGTQGLTVDGAAGGEGGEVTFTTNHPANGAISIGAPVSARGLGGVVDRPAGGGFIEATASAGLAVTKNIDVSGVGGASGVIDLAADRDVVINNSLTGSDQIGGGGLSLSAGHDVTVADVGLGDSIKMNATGNGPGGDITIAADNDVSLLGFLIDVSGTGTGAGGDISVDAGRHVSVDRNTEINTGSAAGSGAVAGSIVLTAGTPDQTGNLTVDGNLLANGHAPNGAANPASIQLTGCQVTISGTGLVDSTGDVNSTNVVTGRKNILVQSNGKLRSTQANIANYTGAPPTVNGATITPALSATAKAACSAPNTPAGCLIPCPTCGDSIIQTPWEDCDPPGCPSCDIHCRSLPNNCADANPCTSNNDCSAIFGCVNAPVPDGGACNDGDLCTSSEKCQNGQCIGTAVVCTDTNVCTQDPPCDPAVGCQHPPVGCPSDGNLCNGAETCTPPGGCHSGQLVSCPTGQVCQPQTGQCVTRPCTNVPGECNDDNPCTTDACVNFACTSTPVTNGQPCANSNQCDGAETCQGGVCSPGAPPTCDDGDLCTEDSCDAALGCQHADVPGCCETPADCGGSNLCTACIDNECTLVMNCCLANGDCEDGNPCTQDNCNQGSHQCEHPAVPGNPACGDVCNPGTCQAGSCATAPIVCQPDTDVCTEDFCDPQSGCVHPAISGCCHTDSECADDDACTADVCNEQNVCTNNPLFIGCTTCSDDLDCDPSGACGQRICDTAAGVCKDHLPPTCTDGNPRTQDLCVVDGAGQSHCENPCFPGVCDDHNSCNGVESCAAGACVAGTPLVCDDGDGCTTDTCDPAAGCVTTPKTGYESARCRLDAIANALQGTGPTDVAPSIRAKISKFLGKARVKIDAAERARTGRPAVKALKAAGKQLKAIVKVVNAARKKNKITAALADEILRAAQGAGQAVDTLKAGAA